MTERKGPGTDHGEHDGCRNEKAAVMGLPLIEETSKAGGIDWKAETVITMTSRDYAYKTIDAVSIDGCLYFRFRGAFKGAAVPKRYLIIRNYRDYTASEIIGWLYANSDKSQTYPLGSHFEDIVRKIYRRDGLSQGYVRSSLREINTSTEITRQ